MRFGERTRSGTRVGTWSQRPTAGVGYGVATGGASSATITVSGQNYTMLTFTASGTLTVTKAGLFDVFLVGGGGSGGAGRSAYAQGGEGGGGGGAPFFGTFYFDSNQTVTVGAGATAGPNIGYQGSLTVISEFIAVGGGGGNSFNDAGQNGWSSGGGGSFTTGALTQIGTNALRGYKGGNSVSQGGGGGGGGAAANGAVGSGNNGGNGGAGYDASAWRGEAANTTGYGGGGGGGGATNGTGGFGGGGNGEASGAANRGGGGGGGKFNTGAGNGGSGVVLVRFKI